MAPASPAPATLRVISGTSASEIADSVREAVERGALAPADALPPVRALAAQLGVNRNTVVAAYRHLAQAGIVVSHGRAGTRVAGHEPLAQEGFAADTVLRDLGTGNPDPDRIPDPSRALAAAVGRPVLYGEPVIDRDLDEWATAWMRDAVGPGRDLRLTVTSGASDAIERLLTQTLARDDAVALEDPCFLSSISTVRLAGFRPVPVAVDAEGMTVAGLRAALDAGVRAVVCTPRAQNPTGASITPRRAAQLREVLAGHPFVLVIEDDHFSMLSTSAFHSVVPASHQRWALVRSVSKFLGPDMCLAVTASDPDTAERLGLRLSGGTTWVSHILQRLALALLTDAEVARDIRAAGEHYAARNAAVAERLRAQGLEVATVDGLNLWVRLPVAARRVVEQLMRRGWLARPGDEFIVGDESSASCLRLTVHDLSDVDAERLVRDIAASVDAVFATPDQGYSKKVG